MQWTDIVGHLNLIAVFTHREFKSELTGLSNIVCLPSTMEFFFFLVALQQLSVSFQLLDLGQSAVLLGWVIS
jgi:hypothetical protein